MFTKNKATDYFPCDINPVDNWYKVDITKIPFSDNSFDFVISNHVLEHIQDEKKAVCEIKRVLKPQGMWMFSFPIRTDENTFEDESIITPEERLKVFGQSDHVRLYGKDYKKRFENYGIKLQEYRPIDVMNDKEIEKNGFIPNDTILIGSFE